MKPTDTNIAIYFGVTRATLINYKKSAIEKQRLYQAMRDKFIKDNQITSLNCSKVSG